MSLIPPEKLAVLWNEGETGKIDEFQVAHYDHQSDWDGRLDCSGGASCAGWMTGGELDTPLGLFAELCIAPGFASEETKLLALREFLKVEGQTWAIQLLRRAGIEEET